MKVDRPLGINLYSPQRSAVIKIKDGGYNIRYEITWHPLAKITPALKAMLKQMRVFLAIIQKHVVMKSGLVFLVSHIAK